jgi:glycosyltransferase involved in cell wall biosynthesis
MPSFAVDHGLGRHRSGGESDRRSGGPHEADIYTICFVSSEAAQVLPSTLEEPLAGRRRLAIVPALNEERTVGRVVAEIHAVDPGCVVVVVDDGSNDRTGIVAEEAGALVLKLPFSLGIGGAVQTGFRYAFEHGFDVAVRVDGDGQHDASQLDRVLSPVLADEADIVVGSRFVGADGYRPSRSRRLGIRILAWTVSRLVGQRVTDATSGFQAVNRRGIALFARHYPHDYPEVEATVMVFRQQLRVVEVGVSMREREHGRSSITALQSIYYMIKVLLALGVGIFRRELVPAERTSP